MLNSTNIIEGFNKRAAVASSVTTAAGRSLGGLKSVGAKTPSSTIGLPKTTVKTPKISQGVESRLRGISSMGI